MAHLEFRHEGHASEHEIRGVTTIGRQSTNDIVVLEEKASRHHARVVPSGGRFILEDLGSGNGTLLNGIKVLRQELTSGDTIRIGNAEIVFSDESAPVRTPNLEGRTLGNYEIHNAVGKGGMGTVYKATQISMDRIVALKVLNRELTRDREFVRAFLNEARTAGKLSHPNVVRVHDFGEARGVYYFSMEYVNGDTVAQLLERKGPIPVGRALEIAGSVASALEHAHKIGIIHRDVKPQNILVDRRGRAKLTDLGLARAARDVSRPDEESIVGTPYYLAPEIAKDQKFDEKSDIYSLGATLFHMVTGRVPFDGKNSLAVINKHVNESVPSPKKYDRSIPDAVCDLIERMLVKNPALRPSSAKDLVRQIAQTREAVERGPEKAPLKAAPAKAPSKPKGTGTAKLAPVKAAPAKPVSTRRRRIIFVQTGSPALYMMVGAIGLAIAGVVIWLAFFTGDGGADIDGPAGRPNGGQPTHGPANTGHTSAAMGNTEAGRKLEEARRAIDAGQTARAEGLCREVMARASSADYVMEANRLLGMMGSGVTAGGRAAEAMRQFRAIEQRLKADPRYKTFAARELVRITKDYPGTKAADMARTRLRQLGVDSPEMRPILNSTDAGGARPSAGEAFGKAQDASSMAEKQGDFRNARRAFVRFIKIYSRTPQATRAAELLDLLETRIGKHFRKLHDRATALSRKRQYKNAADLLKEAIRKDPIGKDRELAEALLEANAKASQKDYEKSMAAAKPYIDRGDLEHAARLLRTAASRFAGVKWAKELDATAQAAELSAEFIKRFSRRLAAHEGPPFKVKLAFKGLPARPTIEKVGPEGLNVKVGRGEIAIPWRDLPAEDVRTIFNLLPLKPEDRLGLAAFHHLHGERAEARRQMELALRDSSIRPKALALLEQLDKSAKVKRFDFSHFEQADEMDLEGAWSLRSGRLTLDEAGIATATLLNTAYLADGFELSFEVLFLEEDGSIEVQLGGDSHRCVWFNLGSAGFQARCSAGGRTAEARGKAKVPTKTPVKVASRIAGDSLRVKVDGSRMKELRLRGLGRIEGPVTFRAQGARLALDNIEIRQGGPSGRD